MATYAHRVEDEESAWRNGLCGQICGGDCGTCLGAWFCPCFLYGRTASRVRYFPAEKKGPCNGDCAIFCISGCFGLSFLPLFLKRMRFRSRYHINGNECTDCLVTCCCTPCALAQMETEVKDRSQTARDANANGYESHQGGMHYGEEERYRDDDVEISR